MWTAEKKKHQVAPQIDGIDKQNLKKGWKFNFLPFRTYKTAQNTEVVFVWYLKRGATL